MREINNNVELAKNKTGNSNTRLRFPSLKKTFTTITLTCTAHGLKNWGKNKVCIYDETHSRKGEGGGHCPLNTTTPKSSYESVPMKLAPGIRRPQKKANKSSFVDRSWVAPAPHQVLGGQAFFFFYFLLKKGGRKRRGGREHTDGSKLPITWLTHLITSEGRSRKERGQRAKSCRLWDVPNVDPLLQTPPPRASIFLDTHTKGMSP